MDVPNNLKKLITCKDTNFQVRHEDYRKTIEKHVAYFAKSNAKVFCFFILVQTQRLVFS